MEKLLELLNEYEIWKTKDKISQNPKRSRRERYRGPLGSIIGTLMNERESRLSIISKSYGFIKWLVENDKIDREKMGRFKAERKNTQIISIANKSDFYLSLLMLLSISDTPIDDLISYLHE